MIKGIGIDIIDVHRIKGKINHDKFIARILTERERQQFASLHQSKRKIEFLAGRFAAKEAFAKATGTGIGKLSFQDIEVLNDQNGAPVIQVEGYQEDYRLFISISHSDHYAVAQVVIEMKERL